MGSVNFYYLQVLAKSSKMIPGQYIVLDAQKKKKKKNFHFN